MGKKQQSRRLRQRARAARTLHGLPWGSQPREVVRGGTPEAVRMASEFSAENEVACRATFLSDPVFGAAAANPPDAESFPVLLLEPKSIMAFRISDGQHARSTHGVLDQRRVPADRRPCLASRPADDWGIYRDGTEVFLRDPDGQVATRSPVVLDPPGFPPPSASAGPLSCTGTRWGLTFRPARRSTPTPSKTVPGKSPRLGGEGCWPPPWLSGAVPSPRPLTGSCFHRESSASPFPWPTCHCGNSPDMADLESSVSPASTSVSLSPRRRHNRRVSRLPTLTSCDRTKGARQAHRRVPGW